MIINTNDIGVMPIEKGGTGQTLNYNNLTLSTYNKGTTGDDSQSCRYYPFLKEVAFRGYRKLGVAVTAKTEFKLWAVSDSQYKPNYIHDLAVSSSYKNIRAYIKSDGIIYGICETALSAGENIYVTGFWFI